MNVFPYIKFTQNNIFVSSDCEIHTLLNSQKWEEMSTVIFINEVSFGKVQYSTYLISYGA